MPILSYWILASFYDMLDVLNPHFVRRFRVTRKVTNYVSSCLRRSHLLLGDMASC